MRGGRRRHVTRLSAALALAATVGAAGCGGPEGEPEPLPADSTVTVTGNFRGRIYERNFVFTTPRGDSAFMVPWLMTAQTRPGGVHRRARGLLARGATWEPFYDQRWDTPPTRIPWRILPHGALRLLVGEGDVVEAVLFTEGQRQLELEFSGASLVEWTGTRGQVYRLVEGNAYLSDQRVQGVILDMSRVHASDDAPGDWAFLTSGDSLQVVLENPTAAPAGTPGAYRAWARLDFRDLQWPALTVDWAAVSAFQPARQDVPTSWTLSTPEGETPLGGVLEVASAHLQAGEGAGPLLPVDALYVVEGTLRVEGRAYPVQGLFRHTRP